MVTTVNLSVWQLNAWRSFEAHFALLHYIEWQKPDVVLLQLPYVDEELKRFPCIPPGYDLFVGIEETESLNNLCNYDGTTTTLSSNGGGGRSADAAMLLSSSSSTTTTTTDATPRAAILTKKSFRYYLDSRFSGRDFVTVKSNVAEFPVMVSSYWGEDSSLRKYFQYLKQMVTKGYDLVAGCELNAFSSLWNSRLEPRENLKNGKMSRRICTNSGGAAGTVSNNSRENDSDNRSRCNYRKPSWENNNGDFPGINELCFRLSTSGREDVTSRSNSSSNSSYNANSKSNSNKRKSGDGRRSSTYFHKCDRGNKIEEFLGRHLLSVVNPDGHGPTCWKRRSSEDGGGVESFWTNATISRDSSRYFVRNWQIESEGRFLWNQRCITFTISNTCIEEGSNSNNNPCLNTICPRTTDGCFYTSNSKENSSGNSNNLCSHSPPSRSMGIFQFKNTDWGRLETFLEAERIDEKMKCVNTGDELNREVEKYMEVLKSFVALTTPMKPAGGGVKRKGKTNAWWNPRLDQLRSEVKRMGKMKKKHHNRFVEENYMRLRKEFRQEIEAAKEKSWKDFTAHCTNPEPWDVFYKVMKKGRNNPFTDVSPKFMSLNDSFVPPATSPIFPPSSAFSAKFFPLSPSASSSFLLARAASVVSPDVFENLETPKGSQKREAAAAEEFSSSFPSNVLGLPCWKPAFDREEEYEMKMIHPNFEDPLDELKTNLINDYMRETQSLVAEEPFIAVHEVQTVIRALEPYKTPGPDGLQGVLFQQLQDIFSRHLAAIFNKALQLSTYPVIWKVANAISVPKLSSFSSLSFPFSSPSSSSSSVSAAASIHSPSIPYFVENSRELENYAYRQLGLLPVVGKIFERVILNRLNYHVERCKWLSPNQHAHRKLLSPTSFLLSLVDKAHSAIRGGEMMLTVSIGICGTFSSSWHHGLLIELIRKLCPPALVHIIHDYLREQPSSWYWAGRRESTEGPMLMNPSECRQGGVLSATLWNILVDSLSQKAMSSDVEIQAYGCDICLSVRGKDLIAMEQTMNESLDIVYKWSLATKVIFNPHDMQVIVFKGNGKRKKNSSAFTYQPVVTFNGVSKKAQRTLRMLGLVFDSFLTWESHVDYITSRTIKMVNGLRRAVGQRWGMSKEALKWLYDVCVEPIMLYSGIVWTSCVHLPKVQRKLLRVQRTVAKFSSRCFPTMKTEVLLRMTGMTPFYVRARMVILKTLIKDFPAKANALMEELRRRPFGQGSRSINCGTNDRALLRMLEEVEADWDKLEVRLPEHVYYVYPPYKYYPKVTMMKSKENSLKEKFSSEPHFAVEEDWRIFCEGAATSEGVGAAFVAYRKGRQITHQFIGLPGRCSVQQAEIQAVILSLHFLSGKGIGFPGVIAVVCVNSTSVLKVLERTKVYGEQTEELQKTLRSLVQMGVHVEFQGVAEQIGIIGNEVADRKAQCTAASSADGSSKERGRDIMNDASFLVSPVSEVLRRLSFTVAAKEQEEWIRNDKFHPILRHFFPTLEHFQAVAQTTRLQPNVAQILSAGMKVRAPVVVSSSSFPDSSNGCSLQNSCYATYATRFSRSTSTSSDCGNSNCTAPSTAGATTPSSGGDNNSTAGNGSPNHSNRTRSGHICACGLKEETVYHYLFECPKYEIQRTSLKQDIGKPWPCRLSTFTSTPMALVALTIYVQSTERFKMSGKKVEEDEEEKEIL